MDTREIAVKLATGGNVEVSRTSDGEYWAHISIGSGNNGETAGTITGSRIDYTHDAYVKHGGDIPPIPADSEIEHIAVKVKA